MSEPVSSIRAKNIISLPFYMKLITVPGLLLSSVSCYRKRFADSALQLNREFPHSLLHCRGDPKPEIRSD